MMSFLFIQEGFVCMRDFFEKNKFIDKAMHTVAPGIVEI